ncbi:hypothetical protein F5Y16DRAFT_412503 [Xylariaceae sp. FL0255]|nr:hypothetical protein F5Y16DRAFT_412503 [Xylariaceae sp. FL0255]
MNIGQTRYITEKITHPDHTHYWITDLDSSKDPITYYSKSSDKKQDSVPLHRSWLRDACSCDQCVDPHSGQKRFSSADVPLEPKIHKAKMTNDGDLEIEWQNDFLTGQTHISRYPPTILEPPKPPGGFQIWGHETLTALAPFFTYQSFLDDPSTREKALRTLMKYGIIFLQGLPHSEETVEVVAAKIGRIQDTFYGKTWDVRSKPQAENVAYTSSYLGLHQDLLYMFNIPRIQILHCLENTCQGGESLFSDGRRAAVHLLKTNKGNPQMIKALTVSPVVYHYHKNGQNYRGSHSLIENGRLKWSPPFQSPVQPYIKQLSHQESFFKAAREVKSTVEEESGVYSYKMQPGDCVVFDNLRVLHGRNRFDTATGERWLKGTYVENASYLSTMRNIFRGHNDKSPW